MKRSELTDLVAERARLTRKTAEDIVTLIFDSMMIALREGKRIEIRGFGSFSVRKYGTYQGRNPKTGQRVQVRPKRLPVFKVGKDLKTRVGKRS